MISEQTIKRIATILLDDPGFERDVRFEIENILTETDDVDSLKHRLSMYVAMQLTSVADAIADDCVDGIEWVDDSFERRRSTGSGSRKSAPRTSSARTKKPASKTSSANRKTTPAKRNPTAKRRC